MSQSDCQLTTAAALEAFRKTQCQRFLPLAAIGLMSVALQVFSRFDQDLAARRKYRGEGCG